MTKEALSSKRSRWSHSSINNGSKLLHFHLSFFFFFSSFNFKNPLRVQLPLPFFPTLFSFTKIPLYHSQEHSQIVVYPNHSSQFGSYHRRRTSSSSSSREIQGCFLHLNLFQRHVTQDWQEWQVLQSKSRQRTRSVRFFSHFALFLSSGFSFFFCF